MKAGQPMKLWFRCALFLAYTATCSLAFSRQVEQSPLPRADEEQHDTTLPNGKSQRDEILKAEHAQNIKDAAQLADMVHQLQEDLEKNDTYVLSIATLKKTDEIEKLIRKIRTRLRRN
jgi:hypothetical protein